MAAEIDRSLIEVVEDVRFLRMKRTEFLAPG
jgi:hypothetical protein